MVVEGLWVDLIAVGGGFDAQWGRGLAQRRCVGAFNQVKPLSSMWLFFYTSTAEPEQPEQHQLMMHLRKILPYRKMLSSVLGRSKKPWAILET